MKERLHGFNSFRVAASPPSQIYPCTLGKLMPCRSNCQRELIAYSESWRAHRSRLDSFVDRFKASLKLINNLDQFTAYAAFVKALLHDPTIRSHPILSKLVMVCTERYQDAQPIISRLVKLENMNSTCIFSNLENEPVFKRPCYNKGKTSGAKLPQLTTSISQIYEQAKECSYWKSSWPL